MVVSVIVCRVSCCPVDSVLTEMIRIEGQLSRLTKALLVDHRHSSRFVSSLHSVYHQLGRISHNNENKTRQQWNLLFEWNFSGEIGIRINRNDQPFIWFSRIWSNSQRMQPFPIRFTFQDSLQFTQQNFSRDGRDVTPSENPCISSLRLSGTPPENLRLPQHNHSSLFQYSQWEDLFTEKLSGMPISERTPTGTDCF